MLLSLDRPNLRAFRLVILLVGTMATVCGQTSIFRQFNPISTSSQGAHLYGVSVFSGYYSGGIPYGTGAAVNIAPSANPSYDVALGSVATFGWNRSGERSGISVTYSPSYFGSIRRSEYNTLNHSFSLTFNRKLTNKWSASASAAGATANFEQMLFAPTTFSTITSMPASFDDLSSAILARKFTDAQLASILTGSPLIASPEQTFLYGQRLLTATLTSSLSYALSGRSSFDMSVSAMRLQQLGQPGPSENNGDSGRNVVPQTTTGAASLGWSFSLSPRTQIGIAASSSRTFTRLQAGYATSANFTIGRTMNRHWFLQGTAGAGTLIYTRTTFTDNPGVQYLAGGTVGFKTFAHTFMASYTRTLGDNYGLGSTSTGSATGAWTWKPPASAWTVFSSFSYQRLSNATFHQPASWHAGSGVARSLSPNVFINVQYSYLRFPYLAASSIDFSQHAVMVALNWSPSEHR